LARATTARQRKNKRLRARYRGTSHLARWLTCLRVIRAARGRQANATFPLRGRSSKQALRVAALRVFWLYRLPAHAAQRREAAGATLNASRYRWTDVALPVCAVNITHRRRKI